MLPFAFYLLKVTICSGILFGYYRLLLRNEVFHNYNRFYLLVAVVLSLVLPLVEIDIWHSAHSPAPTAIKLLQVVNKDDYLDEIVINARQNDFTAEQVIFFCYSITTLVFLGLFIGMLARIRTLFTKHRHSLVEDIYFVNTTAKGTPFSFLKYIFWNDLIDPESTTGHQIFKHELAHVRQKHSYDKLFINATLIFCWCNPFFWLIRKELNMIHEFMADKIAVEDSDTETFAAMILQASYPQHRFQLSNPFFYSPIKRRLLMLTKNKNPKAGYIGRVLVLPLALLVFAAFTLKTKTVKADGTLAYTGKKITVVIDAGHGGADNGAVSPAGNVVEKDITLAIIKKIKAINHNANINIRFTRESDVFQSPVQKAAFTKQQQADLFVSIHTDAAPKEAAARLTGMSVWVPKDNLANADNSKLFASALINEFSTNYKLPVAANPQQSKTGIAVLRWSECPSVLIETGYITNNNDLAFLQTDAAQETIANKILAAVEKYAFAKEKNEPGIAVLPVSSNENFPGEKTDTVPVSGVKIKNLENVLYVVDGKNSSEKELKKIDPKDIVSINVLKGDENTAKYGEKGKNGVIIVTTNRNAIKQGTPAEITIKPDPALQKTQTGESTVIIRNRDGKAAQPLYVIDGEVQETDFKMNTISPNDIKEINVLKDQTAVDKYGSKAANGVIEVKTKNKQPVKSIPISGEAKPNETDAAKLVVYTNDKWLSEVSGKNNVTTVYTPGSGANQNQQQNSVFTKTEYEPMFVGGDSAWRNYLVQNLKADLPLKEGWKLGTYKIVLTFIVEKDGSVKDVTADNYAGTKTAEHCIDLVKKGPKWKPGIQNGVAVNCYRKQPITFVVDK